MEMTGVYNWLTTRPRGKGTLSLFLCRSFVSNPISKTGDLHE